MLFHFRCAIICQDLADLCVNRGTLLKIFMTDIVEGGITPDVPKYSYEPLLEIDPVVREVYPSFSH